MRKEIVDTDILVISRNGDRKITPGMTTAFHARPYGRFIEIQGNLRRKKFHRTNHSSNVLGGSFSNRHNERATIAPVLFDRSNKTCWVFLLLKSTIHLLPQSTVSRRSYLSSEARIHYTYNIQNMCALQSDQLTTGTLS